MLRDVVLLWRAAQREREARIALGATGKSVRVQPTCGMVFSSLVAAVVGAFAFLHLSAGSEIALCQRATAGREACKATAEGISAWRGASPTVFLDDCAAPIVTLVLKHPGQLIVTRVVEQAALEQSQSYSVMMDGRGRNQWRVLDIK